MPERLLLPPPPPLPRHIIATPLPADICHTLLTLLFSAAIRHYFIVIFASLMPLC